MSVSGIIILGTFLAIVCGLFRSSAFYPILFRHHQRYGGDCGHDRRDGAGGTDDTGLDTGVGVAFLVSWMQNQQQFWWWCPETAPTTTMPGTPLLLLRLDSRTSILLHGFVFAASVLNVASHAAVVLGALNDTCVLSILLGVAFDVVTRILQLVWWVWIVAAGSIGAALLCVCAKSLDNNNDNNCTYNAAASEASGGWPDDSLSSFFPATTPPTLVFLSVLAFFYVYHMIVHAKALWWWWSLDENNHAASSSSLGVLQTVLEGALNNLRGIPGEGYKDHFFAYTDLGTHLLASVLSMRLLLPLPLDDNNNDKHSEGRRIFDLVATGASCLARGIFLLGVSWWALSRIPFGSALTRTTTKPPTTPTPPASNEELESLVRVVDVRENRTGVQPRRRRRILLCSCEACTRRKQRTNATGSTTKQQQQQPHRGKNEEPPLLPGVPVVSFTLNPTDGICRLWLGSFEELCVILSSS